MSAREGLVGARPAAASPDALVRLREQIFRPGLAELMRSPATSRWIAVLAMAQLAVSARGITVLACPVRELAAWGCPGCGMTRALLALGRLDLTAMVQAHPFAPLLALALALVLVAAILPARARERLADRVARAETQTGVTALGLLLFVAYWLVGPLVPWW